MRLRSTLRSLAPGQGQAPRPHQRLVAYATCCALGLCAQRAWAQEEPSPSSSLPLGSASEDASTAEEPIEVVVQAERPRRPAERSASDFAIERSLLQAAPHQEGGELLRTVPGLHIARAEGAAVGHRYMLRGFDAEHGQDLELRVGGLPINLPSHVHGQGYSDLGFLIGAAVEELHAQEGVYDPRQGDFAVAGTIDARLGMARRGWRLESSYGAFETTRQLLAWAPPDEPEATFGAVQYQRTSGFGQNRRGQSASGIVQAVFGSDSWRYRALGILYGARASLAGVLRAADVEAGRVGFYDVYPYATARAQSAFAARVLAGLFAEYRGPNGDDAELSAWTGLDGFRLQQNLTGFQQRSRTLANVAGRGDLIEQRNRTRSFGLSSRYRSAPYQPTSWASGTLELALSGRVDEIAQEQTLLDAAVRSQTWDRRVDADILGADLGFWAELDWSLAHHLDVRVGVRADVLYYDVDDRLGNFAPLIRPADTFLVGFRRSALGFVWGPRGSAELRVSDGLALRAAYGEGFRSPQARTLEDGEDAPFSKVRSADIGARAALGEGAELTLSGYYTQLSDDVAFDAREGRLERIGQTRRVGAVFHGRTRLDWLTTALSVTFVAAELLEPPPPSAEEPQPPFRAGQRLPFVPPLVVRLDLGTATLPLTDLGGSTLGVRAGLGYSQLAARPLPYGSSGGAVALVDASAALTWDALELGVELFNVLDARHAADELYYASSWEPAGARSRTPALHRSAGAPLSWLLTLGLSS